MVVLLVMDYLLLSRIINTTRITYTDGSFCLNDILIALTLVSEENIVVFDSSIRESITSVLFFCGKGITK